MATVFLISHLEECLRGLPEFCYEIQRVDSFGQTVESMFLDHNLQPFEGEELAVPEAVIDAVRGLSIGQREYIGEDGKNTYPGQESGDLTAGVYFVRRLGLDERLPDQEQEKVFQIQLVNESGQAVASAYVGPAEDSVTIGDKEVPYAVVNVAHGLPEGPGKYVDANGEETVPWA